MQRASYLVVVTCVSPCPARPRDAVLRQDIGSAAGVLIDDGPPLSALTVANEKSRPAEQIPRSFNRELSWLAFNLRVLGEALDARTPLLERVRALSSRLPEVSVLMTSPWRRAVETGDLLQKTYGRLQRLETEALIPGAEPSALLREFAAYSADPAVALVGHEPHLSRWVSWCVGSSEPLIELRKGGACLLRFREELGPGRARLLWLMTPAILRRL